MKRGEGRGEKGGEERGLREEVRGKKERGAKRVRRR
jgi:hypothetical protein